MSYREIVKAGLARIGGFSALSAVRNRETLTAVMFHRVLPADTLIREEADPEYTVTAEFFSEAVSFLAANYAVVSLADVLDVQAGARPLPSRALLITFDDGWKDNVRHALPILREAMLPSVVFVATDPLQHPHIWWQEVLHWAIRTRRRSYAELWHAAADGRDAPRAMPDQPDMNALFVLYGSLPLDRRGEILDPLGHVQAALLTDDQMLSASDLTLMQKSGMSIGAHGASHLPLTDIADPRSDVVRARAWLTETAGSDAASTISFPHGRYDRGIVQIAREAGFKLFFTSNPVVNACRNGWLASDLIGRIPISMGNVANSKGRFAPHRMAPWLILRDRQQLQV